MCVLVVEDELLIRMGIAILLEDAGHDVLSAHDGADAIDLATRNPGRLTAVVTDHHMPGGLTGTDVVTHIRQSYPSIPVFIATALTSVVPEAWRAIHDVRLVAKPYDPERLVTDVGAAIRHRATLACTAAPG